MEQISQRLQGVDPRADTESCRRLAASQQAAWRLQGVDPRADTERHTAAVVIGPVEEVCRGSIRERILKERLTAALRYGPFVCRGSIRERILKAPTC